MTKYVQSNLRNFEVIGFFLMGLKKKCVLRTHKIILAFDQKGMKVLFKDV